MATQVYLIATGADEDYSVYGATTDLSTADAVVKKWNDQRTDGTHEFYVDPVKQLTVNSAGHNPFGSSG